MMDGRPGISGGLTTRSVAYFLLALAAALVTPSPDVVTMMVLFVAGVAVFELGFFIYRRRQPR